MEDKSKTLLWYGKCGCGWIVTDYPFMSCGKCGYIGSGSEKELENARKGGYLIEWKKEKPKDVPDSEIRDCSINAEQFDYYDEEEEDYEDSWDDEEDWEEDDW